MPVAVDLARLQAVQVVGVTKRIEHFAWAHGGGDRSDLDVVGQLWVLDQSMGDVDAKAIDTAPAPGAEDVTELLAHCGIVPIEIGLLGQEQVAVVLTTAARVERPRRTTEVADPVVRWTAVRGWRAKDVVVAVGTGDITDSGPEPRMLDRRVVGDDVDEHLQIETVRLGDEFGEVGQ